MSAPVKHRFRSLAIGESYEVAEPPSWLRAAVYNYGTSSGKHFSVCKLANGSLEVSRIAGPQTAADISRTKSRGAKLMHARHKAKRGGTA